MKKKNLIIIAVISTILVLITIYMAFKQKAEIFSVADKNTVIELMPESVVVDIDEPKKIKYFFRMDDEDINRKAIYFYTNYSEVFVNIEGEEVYLVTEKSGVKYKSSDSRWNIIHLREKDYNKEITIEIYNTYDAIDGEVEFYYGLITDVEKRQKYANGVELTVLFVVLITSLMAVFLGFFTLIRYKYAKEFYLGMVILSVVIWKLDEVATAFFIFKDGFIYDVLIEIAGMLFALYLLLYLRELFINKNTFLWRMAIIAVWGIIIVRLILQITGVLGFYQTGILQSIACLVGLVVPVIYIFIDGKEMNKTEIYRRNLCFGICVIVIFTIHGTMQFQFKNNDSISISQALLFISCFVLAVVSINQTKKEIEKIKEFELLEKLSYMDHLTGLSNRIAFDDLMLIINRNIKKGIKCNDYIVIFDINGLKECDEAFGQETGEWYILEVIKTVKKVFSGNCKIFKYNEEEIIVIYENIEEKISELISKFKKEISSKKKLEKKFAMSVTIGYAKFDIEQDNNFFDTFKRADEMRYGNKRIKGNSE